MTLAHWLSAIVVFATFTADAKTVRHTFVVGYISGTPDGVWTNTILGINGQFPGPTIEANVGDVLEITVVNQIHDGQNVTIHWHGIHQRGTPFEDGPSQITQCPIKQGSSQIYSFPLTLAGTYWYHSHVNSQYTEGLWGSLIVRGTPEVYESLYDGEILITLTDWYQTSAKENEKWFLTRESGGAPPFPFSALMNGVGRYPCNYARAQSKLCLSYMQRRPVFEVQPGKTYRVRLINTSGWVAFNFTIDGHSARIIEVDGVDITINNNYGTGDAIYIGAGQRYSFLITTNQLSNQAENRFTIRANIRREFLFTLPGRNINPYPEALINEVTGVLQYSEDATEGTGLISPRFEVFDYSRQYPALNQPWGALRFINEMTFVPFDRVPAPANFDTQVNLDIVFRDDADGIRRGSFNGRPFHITQSKPQLAKMVQGLPMPEETFPVYIRYGTVVQVVVNNPELGPHPLHLHGHHFWVVGQGQANDGPYIPRRHELTFTGHRRDTVMIKEKSWIVIRFRADNVGVWTLHCHIDWHNLSGMAMTFVEASGLAASIPVPLEARRVCA